MVEAGEVQPTTGDLTLVGKEKWGRYVEGLSELKTSNTSSPVSLNYDCLLAIFAEMGLKLEDYESHCTKYRYSRSELGKHSDA